MAQTTRTTGGIGTINGATLQSRITALRPNFAPGSSVTNADITELVSLLNTWIAHTHQYYDVGGSSWGDLGYGNPNEQWRTSNNSAEAAGSHPGGTNNAATAAGLNALIAKINLIRSHKHSVWDQTT